MLLGLWRPGTDLCQDFLFQVVAITKLNRYRPFFFLTYAQLMVQWLKLFDMYVDFSKISVVSLNDDTVRRVSIFGVIQSECGKIQTRITPDADTFYAVWKRSMLRWRIIFPKLRDYFCFQGHWLVEKVNQTWYKLFSILNMDITLWIKSWNYNT